MNSLRKLSLALIGHLLVTPLFAGVTDPLMVSDVAERHLRQQIKDLPGKATIIPGKLAMPSLPECQAMEAFTPPGSRLVGRVTIGVRCLTPASWSVLVPFTVKATLTYVTTTHALTAGQTVQAEDLNTLSGDIANLPSGAITDPAQAIGKTARHAIGSGQVVRHDSLVAPTVVRQGQTVRVVSAGSGFTVSSEGRALGNASAGQAVQVRMPGGSTVQGIAQPDGRVEISF